MWHRFALSVTSLAAAASVFACAARDGDGDEGQLEKDATSGLQLSCKSDDNATTFDVKPAVGEGGLVGTLSGSTEAFSCRAAAPGTASGLVATCTTETSGWSVRIAKEGEVTRAVLRRGSETAVLTCVAPTAAVPLATFAEVLPILDGTCAGCHRGRFKTRERVKGDRELMIDMVSSGAMPRGNPTWKDSDEGQTLLRYLRESPELR